MLNRASRFVSFAVAGLLLATGAPLAADPLTAAERQRLVDHLEHSLKLFDDAVAGLSPEQLSFKAAPERWSIAQCVEHLAASEPFIRDIVVGFMAAPATEEQMKAGNGRENEVLAFIVDRSQKFQAPEPLLPAESAGTPASFIDALHKGRQKTIALVQEGADLRGFVGKHPAFGELDAYTWLLFLSGHTERHTLQIQEVKQAPGFPQS